MLQTLNNYSIPTVFLSISLNYVVEMVYLQHLSIHGFNVNVYFE